MSRRFWFVLAFFVFVSTPLFACSCAFLSLDPNAPKLRNGDPVPDREELTDPDHYVFLGEVVEVKPDRQTNPFSGSFTTFRVSRYWSGKIGKEVEIFSGSPAGGCGLVFEKGKTYLVSARKNKQGMLETGICTRTALAEKVPDLLEWIVKLAGEGKTPR